MAGGLGVTVRLPGAVAAYYRSAFLNSTLPGGVVGDVHRGVRHGRESGAVGRCLRAVAWERSAGQVVQLALTVLVLLLLPSPLRSLVPAAVLVAVAAAVAVALLCRRRRPGNVTRAISTLVGDLSGIVRRPRALTHVLLASTAAVGGHVAIFIIAARAAGVSVPLDRLVPVALVVLMASAVPASIAGWGPREGAAAWAFGAAGLSMSQGVTTAVVYGAMALVATLPGLVVLAAAWRRRPGQPSRVADVVHA